MASAQLPELSELVEIGRGSYGVVYRARQEELGRFVAVKMLEAKMGGSQADRFARECSALGQLSGHPHIVAVHRAGISPSGQPYLVMPLCAGGSLADRLNRYGPLPWPEVLDIGVRLAGALQTAHNVGILHRDLKPANVLIDDYGSPQLADFGHARHVDSHLTTTGAVVVTPAYGAPEVLSGAPANPRSDVYSLAATLAGLLAGRGPFGSPYAENVAAVMYRVLHDAPVDLRQMSVPDPICRALEWALAKDPANRPVAPAAFGQALQSVQHQLGVPVTPLTVPGQSAGGGAPIATTEAPTVSTPTAPVASSHAPARRRKTPWLIGAAAVVVVAVAATLVFALREPDTGPAATGPDPESLLLQARDYGFPDLRANSNLQPVFPQLFGSQQAPRATDLSTCLELPVGGIRSWQQSAVYSRGTPITESNGNPEPFATAQSAGLVMNSEQGAHTMAAQWAGPKFDICQEQLLAAGIGFISGKALPDLLNITFTDLPPLVKRPAGSTVAAKRADVPLTRRTGGAPIGHLVIDVLVQAAGKSVITTVVQSFPAVPGPQVQQATASAMTEHLGG